MGAHFHAVQFYKDDSSLVALVAQFLAEGLQRQQPAIIIATPEHRSAIEDALSCFGLDIRRLKQLGDLVSIDAGETLDTILADGMPHPELFTHVVGSLFSGLKRSHPDTVVRAYGELVNLLWKDGLTTAAIRLEMMWNKLAASHEFKLLCGYSMGNFYKDAGIGEITRHHTHLLAESGETATIN